jgi:hypothetical protein
MSDIVDLASDVAQRQLDRAIAAARVPIAAGVAGECDDCSRQSPRLVGGRCAPCRDAGRR